MGKSKHDRVVERLAKKEGVEYNRGQGTDIQSSHRAIEVEAVNTIGDAARQLAGHRKPVYVAGADAEATKKALQYYEGSTIGVIGSSGKTLKRSTRGRKK
jgi:histone H3/H4